MAKILLVEDDLELAERLKDWFSLDRSCVFEVVYDGEDALHMLSSFDYDVVVLDWGLPGKSGLEVCKQYRTGGGQAAIIFLTGEADVTCKEAGLDAGADDYLVKPFDVRELAARIRSLLRRPRTVMTELRAGDLLLRPETRTVTVAERSIVLMPKEAAVLEYLMRHRNRPFTARALLDAIWPSDADASEESVRTTMKRLRQQLTHLDKKELIKTLYGSGYIMEDAGSR